MSSDANSPPWAPFTPNASCAKCLGKEIRARYIAAGYVPIVRTPGGRSLSGDGYQGEHLERICLNCGHTWNEACADKGAKAWYARTAGREGGTVWAWVGPFETGVFHYPSGEIRVRHTEVYDMPHGLDPRSEWVDITLIGTGEVKGSTPTPPVLIYRGPIHGAAPQGWVAPRR